MRRAKILNVDDNEAGRFAVTRMLESAGFIVDEVGTGHEALTHAEQLPDLILLDVKLPDLDGFEVCRRIKSNPRTAAIPVLYMSAHFVAASHRVHGLDLGAEGYITEPVGQHELIATVRAVLRTKEAEATQRFLAQASQLLATRLSADEALSMIARHAVPFLAGVCLVHKVDDDGEAELLTVIHDRTALDAHERPPRFRTDVCRDATHGLLWVLKTGRPELKTDAADPALLREALCIDGAGWARDVGATSYVCVPLVARGRTLGALTLLSTDGRRYGERELLLAEELAARCALLVDNLRLYEVAQRASSAREHLLNVVSHDLKTPLSSVLMNATRALGHVPPGEHGPPMRKHLSGIMRAAERMDHLIRDLLDLASIDAGKLSLSKQTVTTRELIDHAIELLEPLALEKGVVLSVDMRGPPTLLVDQERILQVLSNLLGNAIKFTPGSGRVTITVSEQPGWARVVVSDDGPGISEEQLPHLFDRFWQGPGHARLGTGLGLSIAKALVEAHGGHIEAESGLGLGSTFSFSIPSAPASTPAAT